MQASTTTVVRIAPPSSTTSSLLGRFAPTPEDTLAAVAAQFQQQAVADITGQQATPEGNFVREVRDFVVHTAKQTAQLAADAALGILSVTLGATGPAPVTLSEEEAAAFDPAQRDAAMGEAVERIRAQYGVPGVGFQTPEQAATTERRVRTAGALTASVLAGGPITTSLRAMGATRTLASVAGGAASGAAFGALRERADGESLLQAVLTDAVVFGGLHLAGSLIADVTRPLELRADLAVEQRLAAPPQRPRGPDLEMPTFARRAASGEVPLPSSGQHGTTSGRNVQAAVEQARRAQQPAVPRPDLPPSELAVPTFARRGAAGETAPPRTAFTHLEQARHFERVVQQEARMGEARAAAPARVPRQTTSSNLPASVRARPPADALERGKALYEESRALSENLRAQGLAGTEERALAGVEGVTIATNPTNIGLLRVVLGSPTRYAEVGGPVGDAGGRIVWNGVDRAMLARRIYAEAEAITTAAEKALYAGTRVTQRTMRARLREQVARALDTIAETGELPATMPKPVRDAFAVMRDKWSAERETLRLLGHGAPDWGINAYLPHVFVGEYVVKDAVSGEAILAITGREDLRATLQSLARERPGARFRVEPRRWQVPEEVRGIGLPGPQLARFINQASKALTLDETEVAQLLLEGRIVRPSPGKKFFGHATRREANLSGFLLDPFQADRIYSLGFARKVAFHDYAQKADAVLQALRRVPGTDASVRALEGYVQRVLGRPSNLELAARATLERVLRPVADALPPRLGAVVERAMEPRVLLGKINFLEAISRLGYSPTAWFVNMSQTVVNTASAIGYRPTLRAIRLLTDKRQRGLVDGLLRAMDIDIAVPLSQADQLGRLVSVNQLSPFHPLYLFNRIEGANRAIAGLAQYQAEILRGTAPEQALASAKRFIAETQFIYDIADSPALMSGPLGSTAFQFKRFVVKELEFLWGLRHNPAALLRFMVNVQVVGGLSALMALPPLLLVDWVTGQLTGETLTERLQRAAPHLSRGLPGAVGIDLGGSAAIGLPRETGDVFGPGVLDLWTLARWGAAEATDVAREIQGRAGVLSPQERARFIRQLAPVMARRLIDAFTVAGEGAVRVRGTSDLLFEPEDPFHEALLTGFGFRSIERAEVSRNLTTTNRQIEQHRAAERAVVQRWARAYLDGDLAAADALLADAERRGLVLTRQQLRDAVLDGIVGRGFDLVRRTPPELRDDVLQRLPPALRRRF